MLSLATAHPIAAKQFLLRPITVVIRCRRLLSSVPHHLARKNNSWVNGFVKSIKVPRPIIVANTAIPPRKPSRIESALHEKTEEKEQQSLGICYVGNDNIPITNELKIIVPGLDDVPRGTWPVYRMMVSLNLRERECYSFLLIAHQFNQPNHFLSIHKGRERKVSSNFFECKRYPFFHDNTGQPLSAPIVTHFSTSSLRLPL